jgi:hypothetical protein
LKKILVIGLEIKSKPIRAHGAHGLGFCPREMLKILNSSPPHHPLFLKKIDFYYKRVIRGR